MRLPTLPKLLSRKIYKTGQTRGADNDQIYQNRVGRNSTVLIPFDMWATKKAIRDIEYEKGFIVLLTPETFFEHKIDIKKFGLTLGNNALVFYEKRSDWLKYNPSSKGWKEAISRENPLGGKFVSRIANTTSKKDERINKGFTTSSLKGAGIRQYEYADLETINSCRTQLEALFWLCSDAEEVVSSFMDLSEIKERKKAIIKKTSLDGLLDEDRLAKQRILNEQKYTICPLCTKEISANGFLRRLDQPEGRNQFDLTVTEINLFHIKELVYGELNHKPYNLGWGHHHCNVVCASSGIEATLAWMKEIIDNDS